MKLIKLTKGAFVKVDDADFGWLNQWKWQLGSKGTAIRTDRSNGKKTIRMHRLIMAAPPELDVDHRDTDPLNNQRHNLRLCTKLDNNFNRRTKNPHGHKGIRLLRHGRWQAEISANGEYHYLGCHDTKEQAIAAYELAAKSLHGEFARMA